MKNIESVIYNPIKRTVVVYYKSGAVRTYRGRVPYPVVEYLIALNYAWGYNDHVKECAELREEVR